MSLTKSLAVFLAFGSAAAATHAATINFNNLAGTQVAGYTVVSSNFTAFDNGAAATLNGYDFQTAADTTAWIVGTDYTGTKKNSTYSVNGTDYFLGTDFTMTSTKGTPFEVDSFDLGNWGKGSITTTLVGTRTDGSQVSMDILADYDNVANKVDFASIDLTGFDHLSSLEFSQSGSAAQYIALDNIVVKKSSAVPEPASVALLGLGLAAIARLRRRQG